MAIGQHGLGRRAYWDERNAAYMIANALPLVERAARALQATHAAGGEPNGEGAPHIRRAGTDDARTRPALVRRRAWRQWRWYDQGPHPTCTAHGTYTCMAAAPVLQPNRGAHLGDPFQFYRDIQAIDRAEGRYYREGATGLAAMKAAVRRGWFSRYYWTTDPDVALAALMHESPVMAGTNWYDTMFYRTPEGVTRIGPRARVVGGHWYTVGGYDPRRGLVRIHNTWGDGYYLLPEDDFARLCAEDAEIALAVEVKQPAPASGRRVAA